MKYILALLIVVMAGCKSSEPEPVKEADLIKVNFSDGSFAMAAHTFKYEGYVNVEYPDGRSVYYPWRMISSIDYGK
jgi:hypothetical protein